MLQRLIHGWYCANASPGAGCGSLAGCSKVIPAWFCLRWTAWLHSYRDSHSRPVLFLFFFMGKRNASCTKLSESIFGEKRWRSQPASTVQVSVLSSCVWKIAFLRPMRASIILYHLRTILWQLGRVRKNNKLFLFFLLDERKLKNITFIHSMGGKLSASTPTKLLQ